MNEAKRKRPASSSGPSNPRAQVLAAWRGVDLTAQERALSSTARQAADLLPSVLSDIRLDNRRAEAEVLKVWNHLLDPNLIAHAQPTGLRKGTLFVAVDSSVWLSEIVRYHRKEILTRLQQSFGPDLIQKISFRAG